MKQSKLIKMLAEDTGLSQVKCRAIYETMMSMFRAELLNPKSEADFVPLAGMGRLVRVSYEPRVNCNPRNPDEPMHLPGTFRIMFRPGKLFRAELLKVWGESRG